MGRKAIHKGTIDGHPICPRCGERPRALRPDGREYRTYCLTCDRLRSAQSYIRRLKRERDSLRDTYELTPAQRERNRKEW